MTQAPAPWRSAARARLVRLKSEAEASRAESQRLMQTCVAMTQALRTTEAELAELERRAAFTQGPALAQIERALAEKGADLDAHRAALAAARLRHEETRNAYGMQQRVLDGAIAAAMRVGLIDSPEAV